MIKNDDKPLKKQNRKQGKTSYYLRFHESGRINTSRFYFSSPDSNDTSEADSGQTAKQALQDSKRFITNSASRTSKVISHATGKGEKKSAAISQNNGFRLKRGSTKGSSFNSFSKDNSSMRMRGSISASGSSKETINLQKQHIKKEYQKKAMAAIATAVAPETAAVSAATKTAQSIPSKNKDGSGKFGIIVVIMCLIPMIIPVCFIYTAAFLIEPAAEYLDARIEEYKSGFAGDGSSDIIIDASQSPVSADALNDPDFAALITEAEKYLGYPYVWGGSSPSTSFDCSGFICWVYSQSGVYDLPRMTAQSIYNKCTIVQASEVRPGDLVFFTDTYTSSYPVTHVGIYAGDSYMIHAGDPIQYISINTPYWADHFYAYGRLTD